MELWFNKLVITFLLSGFSVAFGQEVEEEEGVDREKAVWDEVWLEGHSGKPGGNLKIIEKKSLVWVFYLFWV